MGRTGRLVLAAATLAAVLMPAVSSGAPGPATVALGVEHSCALVNSNIECWGANANGQLGDGTTIDRHTAVYVDTTGALNGVAIAQVAAGASHSCARSTAGAVFCWGSNSDGQLGDGTGLNRLTPTPVDVSTALAGVQIVDISIGSRHTCALSSPGKTYCWGYNGFGQLGDGSTTNRSSPTPVDTSGALNGASLAHLGAGNRHTCAISTTGAAFCWGDNTYGQVGDGTTTDRTRPTALATTGALNGVSLAQISANVRHTCAVSTAGRAYCWGANGVGQLGDGTTTSRTRAVAVVTTGALNNVTVVDIGVGYRHTCARSSTGNAYCWGSNDAGQLGDDTTTNRVAPVAAGSGSAMAGTELADMDVGDSQTCAGSVDGNVFCWGSNSAGQVGDGTTVNRASPIVAQLLPLPSPSPSVSASPSESPSASPTPSPTDSLSPSDPPSPSPTPSSSGSPTPSDPPSPSPGDSPSASPPTSPTESPSPIDTPSPALTPTVTPSTSTSASAGPTHSSLPSSVVPPSASSPVVTPSATTSPSGGAPPLVAPSLPPQVPTSDGVLMSSAGVVLTVEQRSTVLSGSGFLVGSPITLGVYSAGKVLAIATIGADGTFSTPVTISEDLSGQHTFVAIGYRPGGALRTLTASFRVVRSTLPTTSGPPAIQAGFVGSSLLLLGVLLFAAASAGRASRVIRPARPRR